MLIRIRRKVTKAQASLEYAALIGVVVGAIILMSVYMKRSVQGKIHKESDSIGNQFDINGTYNYTSNMQAGQQDVTYSVTGARNGDIDLTGVAPWVNESVKPGEASQVQYTEQAAARNINERTSIPSSQQ